MSHYEGLNSRDGEGAELQLGVDGVFEAMVQSLDAAGGLPFTADMSPEHGDTPGVDLANPVDVSNAMMGVTSTPTGRWNDDSFVDYT